MEYTFYDDVKVYTSRHKIRNVFRRFVRILACMVAFATTYALILPAITMEKESFCGFEEHVHEESCYVLQTENRTLTCTAESLQIHVHSDGCYSSETLICNQADYVVHAHDDSCYLEDQLVCTLPVREQHVHGESCYDIPEPIAHEHTESCEEPVRGELLCTEEEREGHAHGEGCYESGDELVCTLSEVHRHGDGCYTSESKLVCTLPVEAPEGEQVHQHDDSCYSTETKLVCTEPENHLHEQSCYKLQQICEIPEDPGHAHEDGCYEWTSQYICGMEAGELVAQEPVLICTQPVAGTHTHSETCFEITSMDAQPICSDEHEHTYECYELSCQLQEHKHDLPCYSDPTADVESQEYWESTMAGIVLTGDWNQDVVAIAESQLGYRESEHNYAVWEDNTVHGYTRYGAWYDMPYADWCGMFASFCLHYADVEGMPYHYGVRPWIEQLSAPELDLYRSAADYTPIPGDLVFFDWEQDGLSDHVGIVYEVGEALDGEKPKLRTIEGNSGNCVQICSYDLDDPRLLGYSRLPARHMPEEVEEETPVSEAIPPRHQPVYDWICGMPVHGHGPDCLMEDGTLQCGLQIHVHTMECADTSSPVGYVSSAMSSRARFALRTMPVDGSQPDGGGGNIQYLNDIGSLLIGVVIQDKDGNTVYDSSAPDADSGEIILGDMYEVFLSFKENTSYQYGSGELVYTIPPYLASNEVSNGIIVDDETSEVVARYIINGNQLVITPEPAADGEPHYFESHVDTEINIEIDAQAVFDPQSDHLDIVFSQDFTASFITKENGRLEAQKELLSYDPLTRTARFQCTTTAIYGTVDISVISDYWWVDGLSPDHVTVLPDSITMTDGNGTDISGQWNIAVDYRDDIWISPKQGTAVPLAREESIILTYDVQFSQDLTSNFQYLNTYYNYGSFEGQPREATAPATTPIAFTNVKKQGLLAWETIDGVDKSILKWTVTLTNQEQKEITITDQLSAGQTLCEHQNISVLARNPNTGQNQQLNLTWQPNGDKTGFTMTLPAGYTQYELVYYSHYTLQKNGPDIQEFSNTVTTDVLIAGTPTSGTANVGVMGVLPTLDKRITSTDADNHIAFTIESFMPGALYGQTSVYLYDYLATWEKEEGFPQQNLDGLTVTIQPVDGESYQLQPYTDTMESAENTYLLVKNGTEFTMYFNTGTADLTTSRWNCDTDSKLTVSYRVPLDTPMLSHWGGTPGEENLTQFLQRTEQGVTNQAELGYSPTGILKDSVRYVLPEEEKPPLAKTARAVEGEKGVFAYSVWFNTGDNEKCIFPQIKNQGTFQNDVSNLIMTDTFDSRLEYVEDSLQVSIWGYWNHKDLVLTYKPEDDTVVVNGNQITAKASDLIGVEGTEQWLVGRSLAFALQNNTAGYQYEFTYRLRVSENTQNTATDGVLYMDNTAQVDWEQTDGPKTAGPVTCQVAYDTGILQKNMQRVAEDRNLLSFSILINENGLDLVPYMDTFVLHDQMTPNLTLIYTSLQIELLDENGAVTEIRKPEECGFAYNPDENTMTFTLPDRQTIRLKYDCKVNGEEEGEQNVGNKVWLEGHEDITDEVNTKFLIHDHTGNVGSSSSEFMLQKQDAYTFRVLPGVSFELYGDTERKGSKTITIGNKTLWYYQTFTTDENGMVLIQENQMSSGHLYALRELEPPAGYLPQEEPYLFYMEHRPNSSSLEADIVAEGALVVIKNFSITYELPKTGAAGTQWFTLCGLILSLPVTYQFYRKRKKEDFDTS